LLTFLERTGQNPMSLKKKQKLPQSEPDMKDMEDSANLLETLLERAAEYRKTSIELVKLKTLDKQQI